MKLGLTRYHIEDGINANPENLELSELVEWFSVSGDTDDFIYYGEDPACSER